MLYSRTEGGDEHYILNGLPEGSKLVFKMRQTKRNPGSLPNMVRAMLVNLVACTERVA